MTVHAIHKPDVNSSIQTVNAKSQSADAEIKSKDGTALEDSLINRYVDGSVCIYEGPLKFHKALACMALQKPGATLVSKKTLKDQLSVEESLTISNRWNYFDDEFRVNRLNDALRNMPRLQMVDLSNNGITADQVMHLDFSNNSSLRLLDLSRNALNYSYELDLVKDRAKEASPFCESKMGNCNSSRRIEKNLSRRAEEMPGAFDILLQKYRGKISEPKSIIFGRR